MECGEVLCEVWYVAIVLYDKNCVERGLCDWCYVERVLCDGWYVVRV